MDRVAIARWVIALLGIQLLARWPIQKMMGDFSAGLVLPLVLLLSSYIYWLWGLAFSIPPGSLAAWVCVALAIVLLWFFSRFAEPLTTSKRASLLPEIVLGIFFFLALWIRSLAPALDQTEKLADMAMFNGVLVEEHFPPQDRWASGLPLNYYYFSYVLFAPLTRITEIPAEWAFNLAVCTVFALSASGVYSFVAERTRQMWVALAAAFALVFFSNWEWVRTGFTWWTSSRAIKNTITEFPYFSFLLGDFHAHFSAIPWLTLPLALLSHAERVRGAWLVLMALALGVQYPLNPWQLPFLGLLLICLWKTSPKKIIWLTVLGIIFFAPFWFSFERPVSGVFWVQRSARSALDEFVLHWGLFLIPLVWVLARAKLWPKLKVTVAILVGAAMSVWPLGLSATVILTLLAFFWSTQLFDLQSLDAILVSAALLVIAACEWFSLDATYGSDLIRLNTVFKFYTMTWWALAVGVPCFLWRKREFWLRQRWMSIALLGAVVFASLVYPYRGTLSRVGRFDVPKTLDGLAYWEQVRPGEREAVNWLRANTLQDDVIWEADGPAYSHYARFSAFSGRPTILGWGNHQWVWRKKGRELTQQREGDLARVKKEASPVEVTAFIRKYKVKFIVIGALERETFPEPLLALLGTYPVVFSGSTTTVYRAP